MPKQVKKQPGDTRGAWRKRVGMGGVCLTRKCKRKAHLSSDFCKHHCPMYVAGFKAGKKAACAAVRKYVANHPYNTASQLVAHAIDGRGVHMDRCPECGADQVTRTNRTAGRKFQGCAAFPKCRWSLQVDDGRDCYGPTGDEEAEEVLEVFGDPDWAPNR